MSFIFYIKKIQYTTVQISVEGVDPVTGEVSSVPMQVDLVVQARFSRASAGIVRGWVNGCLMVDLVGANTLGTTPLFFKYGIYRSYVSRKPLRPAGVAYWDEVRMGKTRSDVDPRVNPRLLPLN